MASNPRVKNDEENFEDSKLSDASESKTMASVSEDFGSLSTNAKTSKEDCHDSLKRNATVGGPSGSKVCTYCGQGGKLSVCSRCKAAFYCSREHQKAHYPTHKRGCRQQGEALQIAAKTLETVQLSEDVPWGELPLEVIACVLSFLSVPVLCRLRTVCKGWNELLCTPIFHDLHENNNRHRPVCFLRRFKVCHGYTAIDIPVQNTTCFLEFDERRWYTIKGAETGYDTRVIAMDDHLVAEYWSENEEEAYDNVVPTAFGVEMIDPISKLSFTLEPPFRQCPPNEVLPTLVLAADPVSRSFRIFLIDNSGHMAFGLGRFLRIYDSSSANSTDGPEVTHWRCASYPPNLKWEGARRLPSMTPEINPITRCRSAAFFRGDLYTILSPFASEVCFLMKYDCQNDSWSMIVEELPRTPSFTFDLNLKLKLKPAYPQLMACGNKLYMWFWSFGAATYSRGKLLAPLEMVEVEIPHNTLKTVFQITPESLDRFFGEAVDDIAGVHPCLNSDGSCSSVRLVSGSTGRVIVYNLLSGSAEQLPPHPLGFRTNLQHRDRPPMQYWATFKKLSLRETLPKRCRRHPPFPFRLRDHTKPLQNVKSLYVLDFAEDELDDY